MKILILGGTVFLGRHITQAALDRGHEVTLFNRGKTHPELFEGMVEKIKGDRSEDLHLLDGRAWDACIDPSGYLPAHMTASGKQLTDCVAHYSFVSSISVYAKFVANMDESAPVVELPEGADANEYDNDNYGPLKALCETAIEAKMPGRVLQVRSGLIVGPFDPTNRFTYWPARIQEGGELLAPVVKDFPIQVIHARDQADWILDMAEHDVTGTFNVTGKMAEHNLGDLLSISTELTGSENSPVWVDETFLLEQEVGPWVEMPLWLPTSHVGMAQVNIDKLLATGFNPRSLRETVEDTLDWYNQQPAQTWPAGMSREREQSVLDAWRKRHQ